MKYGYVYYDKNIQMYAIFILFDRNCGRGEGIFTFYSPNAKEMVMALAETSRKIEHEKC